MSWRLALAGLGCRFAQQILQVLPVGVRKPCQELRDRSSTVRQ